MYNFPSCHCARSGVKEKGHRGACGLGGQCSQVPKFPRSRVRRTRSRREENSRKDTTGSNREDAGKHAHLTGIPSLPSTLRPKIAHGWATSNLCLAQTQPGLTAMKARSVTYDCRGTWTGKGRLGLTKPPAAKGERGLTGCAFRSAAHGKRGRLPGSERRTA